jgi:hypothetical protein
VRVASNGEFTPALLRVGAFARVGNAKEKMLVGDRAHKLEANGQTVGSESTGNGNCGKAAEVGGAIVAEEQGAGRMIGAADGGGFLAD